MPLFLCVAKFTVGVPLDSGDSGDQGDAVVGSLYREAEIARLKPQNGEHEDIVVPAEDVRIQGRVVYVIHPPRN